MSFFGRKKSLDTRYLQLKEQADHALTGHRADLWPSVRDTAWELLREAVMRFDSDPRAPIVAHATAKIAIVPELASGSWLRVLWIGWAASAAVATLDVASGPESDTGLMAALAEDLYRRAEVTAYAAHRAGVPMAGAVLAEQFTSLRLGERTLWRSILAMASRSTADLEHVAGVLSTRMQLARESAGSGGFEFRGEPEQLNAWFERSIRQEFAAGDQDRRGGRVAMSTGVGAAMEAMRLSGRSLLYVGGGPEEGVAVLLDAAALNDPDRLIAGSISLPGVDFDSVQRAVAGLHQAAADRRSRRVSGRVLTEQVEKLLAWLGESVWRPVLERWPEVSQQPLTVIPLGEFAQLPLYTATVAGRPACAELDLTIAPSARSLVLAGEHPAATGRVLVAADPSSGDDTLPYVVDEARAVAAVHGTEPVIYHELAAPAQDDGRLRTAGHPSGESAGPELLGRLRGSALVHLACHGIIAPDRPLESALLLGGDLTLETVLAEDLLPGCTVVLSACDLAGIGTDLPGEQLGFPGVLLAGAARTVVAALWPVPDTPRTVRLMTRFHEELRMTTPTRALGAAIGHAFDAGAPGSGWAPFTCFGA
ncbi:CHAT domain-containing protein [Actinoplanes sp. NPDC026670]|uniref:CHAT domain-containing protein n=1 Tax=Actinoplanes sp. NPDC026670 TaxID=3154700 RepID=UPI0033E080D1